MKRREAKSKGEKERYRHPNEEFQRIARRDETAFFSDQCKEIEEFFELESNRRCSKRDCFIDLQHKISQLQVYESHN